MATNAGRTLQDIMRLSPAQRKEYYTADIGYVVIDGNKFDNFGVYSFLWEKSYVKEPTRSSDGSIGNLDSYATFLTGHLQIDFSLMSIDYYRTLMKLIYSKNEFTVECYDIVNDKMIKLRMYFATEEMPTLLTIAQKLQKSSEEWEEWIELVGIQEYTVELIGTNNDLDTIGVIYHYNPPSSTGQSDTTIGESDVVAGDEIIIGGAADWQTETFNGQYKFKYWCDKADGSGAIFIDSQAYTVNSDLVLYAIWEATSSHTLTYNYGLGKPRYDSNNEPIYNKQISYGTPLGTLPSSEEVPSVTYDKVEYKGADSPYYNGGWYKTPVKATAETPVEEDGVLTYESVPLTSATLYWLNRDTTIYQLYDTKSYAVNFNSNGGTPTFNSITAKYGTSIALPNPIRNGFTFKGWYLNGKSFSGTMPPFNITLVAEWQENEE